MSCWAQMQSDERKKIEYFLELLQIKCNNALLNLNAVKY